MKQEDHKSVECIQRVQNSQLSSNCVVFKLVKLSSFLTWKMKRTVEQLKFNCCFFASVPLGRGILLCFSYKIN